MNPHEYMQKMEAENNRAVEKLNLATYMSQLIDKNRREELACMRKITVELGKTNKPLYYAFMLVPLILMTFAFGMGAVCFNTGDKIGFSVFSVFFLFSAYLEYMVVSDFKESCKGNPAT